MYLTGLKKIYDFYKADGNLDILLTGKVSLAYVNVITKWQEDGLAKGIKHKNIAFVDNLNTNNRLDFILENLK